MHRDKFIKYGQHENYLITQRAKSVTHLQNDVGSSLQYRSYLGIYDLIGKYNNLLIVANIYTWKMLKYVKFILIRGTNNDDVFLVVYALEEKKVREKYSLSSKF